MATTMATTMVPMATIGKRIERRGGAVRRSVKVRANEGGVRRDDDPSWGGSMDPIARDGVGRARRARGEVERVEIGSEGETDE